ncbi:hypothetical protein [Methanoculleus sp.]|uniref:hypothetical protein n=1 Tax=Methanoculleus sp. TaxID=90427 RepID=UPI001BD2A658|nr:hypothetical protein [Methanoculleus sp.]
MKRNEDRSPRGGNRQAPAETKKDVFKYVAGSATGVFEQDIYEYARRELNIHTNSGIRNNHLTDLEKRKILCKEKDTSFGVKQNKWRICHSDEAVQFYTEHFLQDPNRRDDVMVVHLSPGIAELMDSYLIPKTFELFKESHSHFGYLYPVYAQSISDDSVLIEEQRELLAFFTATLKRSPTFLSHLYFDEDQRLDLIAAMMFSENHDPVTSRPPGLKRLDPNRSRAHRVYELFAFPIYTKLVAALALDACEYWGYHKEILSILKDHSPYVNKFLSDGVDIFKRVSTYVSRATGGISECFSFGLVKTEIFEKRSISEMSRK